VSRARFDRDIKAELFQLQNSLRHSRDPFFARMYFLWNANSGHKENGLNLKPLKF
jgi:hypothetical protein